MWPSGDAKRDVRRPFCMDMRRVFWIDGADSWIGNPDHAPAPSDPTPRQVPVLWLEINSSGTGRPSWLSVMLWGARRATFEAVWTSEGRRLDLL